MGNNPVGKKVSNQKVNTGEFAFFVNAHGFTVAVSRSIFFIFVDSALDVAMTSCHKLRKGNQLS